MGSAPVNVAAFAYQVPGGGDPEFACGTAGRASASWARLHTAEQRGRFGDRWADVRDRLVACAALLDRTPGLTGDLRDAVERYERANPGRGDLVPQPVYDRAGSLIRTDLVPPDWPTWAFDGDPPPEPAAAPMPPDFVARWATLASAAATAYADLFDRWAASARQFAALMTAIAENPDQPRPGGRFPGDPPDGR